MNVENVNKLIDHLESIDDSEYCQRTFTHDCGTPACIAGHTACVAGAQLVDGANCIYPIYPTINKLYLQNQIDENYRNIGDFASEYLELSEDENLKCLLHFLLFMNGKQPNEKQ